MTKANNVLISILLGSALLSNGAPGAIFKKTERSECEGFLRHNTVPEQNVDVIEYNFPELEVAALNDKTGATGATLFYFKGLNAVAAYDSRGGSVASSETTLLDQGAYSNVIDGIVFSGGSTMGLAAGDGVRDAIFQERAQSAGSAFDFIPSIPTAVIYDYDGRILSSHDPLAYPTRELGAELYAKRSTGNFPVGRIGAGINSTVNKIGRPRFGGQGAAFRQTPVGKLFVAVVPNAVGDIVTGTESFAQKFPSALEAVKKMMGRKNTTLSLVVTDVDLTPNQLKRLATSVHTSMGGAISPFHTYTDGDIMFVVSAGKRKREADENTEFMLAMEAGELMKEAIYRSVETANRTERP